MYLIPWQWITVIKIKQYRTAMTSWQCEFSYFIGLIPYVFFVDILEIFKDESSLIWRNDVNCTRWHPNTFCTLHFLLKKIRSQSYKQYFVRQRQTLCHELFSNVLLRFFVAYIYLFWFDVIRQLYWMTSQHFLYFAFSFEEDWLGWSGVNLINNIL